MNHDSKFDYPDSAGKPLADDPTHFQWLNTLYTNLDAAFADDPNVLVAGSMLWYPVLGDPRLRMKTDIMVAMDRPKGARSAYRQWREANAPPHVVFDVLAKTDKPEDVDKRLDFHERFGVEEYYVYNPTENECSGWVRVDRNLKPVLSMHGWISPLLGIRFDLSESEPRFFLADGSRFLSFSELSAAKKLAENRLQVAVTERESAVQQMEWHRRQKVELEQRAAQTTEKCVALEARLVQAGTARETVEKQLVEQRRQTDSLRQQIEELNRLEQEHLREKQVRENVEQLLEEQRRQTAILQQQMEEQTRRITQVQHLVEEQREQSEEMMAQERMGRELLERLLNRERREKEIANFRLEQAKAQLRVLGLPSVG